MVRDDKDPREVRKDPKDRFLHHVIHKTARRLLCYETELHAFSVQQKASISHGSMRKNDSVLT